MYNDNYSGNIYTIFRVSSIQYKRFYLQKSYLNDLIDQVAKSSRSDSNISILGETSVGKEIVI